MAKVSRRVAMRAYRRKKKSSGFKKAVSTIAKKVVLRQAETKTAKQAWTTAFGSSGTFFSVNGGGMLAGITQGTAQENRVGDEITMRGLKLRGRVNINGGVLTAGREYASFRLLICSGKRPLTSGDMPLYQDTIDPEKITVISDTYHKLSSTNWLTSINKYIRFPRRVKFVGNVPIKNDMYIWVIPVPLGTGLTTTDGYGLDLTFQPYFKDM